MMTVLAGVAAVLGGVGVAEALVVSRLVAGFAHRRPAEPSARPPVTVLKPLHGDEPLLEEALETLCRQDYPEFQIVFGVREASDPAVVIVRRLQARFPGVDIALVVDSTLHGRNHKVSNLINMLPAARHDVLVIADADVHARPDYLDRLVAALEGPGVGLVTTLYAGLPVGALPARLGAAHITYGFLPSAVLSRRLGRQDCLGATMGLRRDDLDRIGGLRALVDHLADDNVLGQRIAALGLRIALADTVVLTTVPEASVGALFRHELRWARTIRALEPVGFAASVVQYPLAWALLTVLLAGGALWSIGVFCIAWVLRAAAALVVDGALTRAWSDASGSRGRDSIDVVALAFCCPVWLLPLRDVFSVAVMLASYGGRQVDWRGHGLHADTPPPFTRQAADPSLALRRIERTNAQ
ncbi:bacteriohopanetetrol glucosamine biosynthesis glycosyltransferase HpnI [Acidisphaera sp. S103]|uniref:bacteriohopanetetrol glucosamine biosynthesis glycosyltransferase HpnI n=1 Tax=Acidisphaera sp. S103 TaxID=1747223 RepID=UPI00131E964F|nr:bacteriohopanetetrol glucosamine biosynthesis glycosyltransferase HpnI [Acidisphaera sp. S103]